MGAIVKLSSSEISELANAEAMVKAKLSPLRLVVSGEPTARQIAAASAVENFIVTSSQQQVGWAKLRLIALHELGEFLLRTPGSEAVAEKSPPWTLCRALPILGLPTGILRPTR
jgi:hypothetical protein